MRRGERRGAATGPGADLFSIAPAGGCLVRRWFWLVQRVNGQLRAIGSTEARHGPVTGLGHATQLT